MVRVFISFVCLFATTLVSHAASSGVKVRGYDYINVLFNKQIDISRNIKAQLPPGHIYHLEFLGQIRLLKKDSLTDLDNLGIVTVEGCELGALESGAFQNLPHLFKVNLKKNKLERIVEGVFNGLPLSILDLRKNRIRIIESKALNDLPNLTNIYLSFNDISVWDNSWFKNTPKLLKIYLQNNSLETLPNDAFLNIKGRTRRDRITFDLDFSYNKISIIEPHAFRGLKIIDNLWLHNNNIKEYDDNIFEGLTVINLRLNNNSLQCIDGELENLARVETIDLDNNPYDCQCVEKIKRWSDKNEKNVMISFSRSQCLLGKIQNTINELRYIIRKDREEVEETTSLNEVEVFLK